MAHTNNESKQEAKETDILKESLLLSCSTVGRTTSSCMAERSVQWHEHKLSEQKSELDQKLYKSIIKINSERLEIVDELSKLKKSSSTGALESTGKNEAGWQKCCQ
ncbi:hypothetical protein DPMN_044611 [Dreissena polymorpha]|uniref:Uncharacterized protein n=1 Tax=Dreissena polymorpha TaxID=45954 RepID=A0A9D4HYZ8_DREPO|nr:hypothetical protein DPMN_044611 [Dreissena polymorpha]